VSNEVAVGEAIRAAVDRFGELHILYNNAGVLWRDRDLGVLETDEAIWDRVMAAFGTNSTGRGMGKRAHSRVHRGLSCHPRRAF